MKPPENQPPFGAGFMEEKRREAKERRAAHRNRLVGTYAGVCSAPSAAAPAEPETTYASGVAEPRATDASVRSPRFQEAEPTPTDASVRSRQTGKVAAA